MDDWWDTDSDDIDNPDDETLEQEFGHDVLDTNRLRACNSTAIC